MIIEHEMKITTTKGTLTPDQLTAINEKERQTKSNRVNLAPKKFVGCPFKNGMSRACTEDACALFIKGSGCYLSKMIDKDPVKETKGLACPFNSTIKCGESCALFKGCGCAITGLREVKNA